MDIQNSLLKILLIISLRSRKLYPTFEVRIRDWLRDLEALGQSASHMGSDPHDDEGHRCIHGLRQQMVYERHPWHM